MTKAELVQTISDKASLSKTQAKDALEAFIGAVTDTVKSGRTYGSWASATSYRWNAPPAPRATRARARPSTVPPPRPCVSVRAKA